LFGAAIDAVSASGVLIISSVCSSILSDVDDAAVACTRTKKLNADNQLLILSQIRKKLVHIINSQRSICIRERYEYFIYFFFIISIITLYRALNGYLKITADMTQNLLSNTAVENVSVEFIHE
jgi:hypothetical protein